MRQSAILLLPLVLLACQKEPKLNEAAIHVQLNYDTTFKQGCITVLAQGGEGKVAERSFDMPASLKEDLTLDVVVFRQKDWSRDVQVTVTVQELDCTSGRIADQRQQTFSLAEAGWKEWKLGQLNTKDADGDGYVALSEDGQWGSDCDDGNAEVRPSATEICNGRDDNCDGTMDEGHVTRSWYLDADRDGVGRVGPGTEACAAPSALHVEITGDCDDERADVRPGTAEACNGRDDDCNGDVDELFTTGVGALGTSCSEACGGTYACNAAGTGTECRGTAFIPFYTDVDGDGEGERDSAPAGQGCPGETPPTGLADNTRDCDDKDGTTNTGAMELCDGLDNDCDGAVDEGISCGQLRRVADVALDGRDWTTVAVHPSGYPVWVAGMGGKLAVKMNASSPFVSHDTTTTTGCGPANNNVNWNAAWINPNNNYVVLGGQDGWVGEHNGGSCAGFNQVNLPGSSDYFSGVVGLGSPIQTFYVSTAGHLHEMTAAAQRHDWTGRYWGIHALGTDTLYTVGSLGESPPHTPVVNLYTRSNNNWGTPQSMPLQGVEGYNGSLRAVWAAGPELIYAVGDRGLAVKGTGQARGWDRVPSPTGPAVDYVSVAVPPGTENAYVIGNEGAVGRLHRLTPHGWARAPAFTTADPVAPLRDIAMSAVGDFWIVGDDGHVYHFPETPASAQP